MVHGVTQNEHSISGNQNKPQIHNTRWFGVNSEKALRQMQLKTCMPCHILWELVCIIRDL